MRILVVSDGRTGIENQALGLAEAVARNAEASCDIANHVISHGAAFTALPPSLQLMSGRNFGLSLSADLIIGCGRQAIAPLIDIQRRARRSANARAPFTVFVQDPHIDPSRFDLVIAPEHDGLTGPFVETMIGSPNRVTRDKIIMETLNFADKLGGRPMPRAAFLIGGNSARHTLDKASLTAHLETAQQLRALGHSIMVTVSRRTPDEALRAWENFAATDDKVWLHKPDSAGPNPYFAFLGGAEAIFVTEDSTNMLTEACATGKPVYRLPMAGDAKKFTHLYEALQTRCGVERWSGGLSAGDYEPLRETERAAQLILDRMAARTT